MSEYLVKVTIRNNLILRRMKQLGIKSQSELAKRSGLPNTTVSELIRMKRRPVHVISGEWLDVAFALSSALQTEPEELWTQTQRGMALESNSREVDMSEEAVMQLASGDDLERRVLSSKVLNEAMEVLTPREQDILHRRFFKEETLREIGDDYGISADRINQIEHKALRKLKHPSRSRVLRSFIEN